MMRSMYSAVSGLRSHQTKMDVIGNNIANVNTVGFKKGQVTFQEVFSEKIRGAGAPQGGKGGTNPQQIGLGVSVGAIDTIHTKGPEQSTGKPTDIMIDGEEGFFVVTDDPNFNNRYYTRAGNFSVDEAGTLITPDGFKLLGYSINKDGEVTNTVTPIRINKSETIAPEATTKIEFQGILDERLPSFDVDNEKGVRIASTEIHDGLGNAYTVRFKLKKGATVEEGISWNVELDKIIDLSTEKEIEGNVNFENMTLNFDKNGNIIDNPSATLSITKDGVNFGDDTGVISIDFSKLKQFANESTAIPNALNGNTSGTLNGFSIDPSGVVEGIFTNGKKKALGQIMLAKFSNPAGLEKMGNNFFRNTRNSGEPQIGIPGTVGLGALSPGNLEMSNVDLSMEFTEMITTQRGFQANSRVITTSDEMLQELVNMKR